MLTATPACQHCFRVGAVREVIPDCFIIDARSYPGKHKIFEIFLKAELD
jgi:hypothetical protein